MREVTIRVTTKQCNDKYYQLVLNILCTIYDYMHLHDHQCTKQISLKNAVTAVEAKDNALVDLHFYFQNLDVNCTNPFRTAHFA